MANLDMEIKVAVATTATKWDVIYLLWTWGQGVEALRKKIENTVISKGLTKKIAVASANGSSASPKKKVRLAKTTASPLRKCIPRRRVFKTWNVPPKGMKIVKGTNNPIRDLTKTF